MKSNQNLVLELQNDVKEIYLTNIEENEIVQSKLKDLFCDHLTKSTDEQQYLDQVCNLEDKLNKISKSKTGNPNSNSIRIHSSGSHLMKSILNDERSSNFPISKRIIEQHRGLFGFTVGCVEGVLSSPTFSGNLNIPISEGYMEALREYALIIHSTLKKLRKLKITESILAKEGLRKYSEFHLKKFWGNIDSEDGIHLEKLISTFSNMSDDLDMITKYPRDLQKTATLSKIPDEEIYTSIKNEICHNIQFYLEGNYDLGVYSSKKIAVLVFCFFFKTTFSNENILKFYSSM